MDPISILAAGIAGFAVVGVWQAATGRRASRNPAAYVVAAIGMIVVAAMMDHIFLRSGVATVGAGIVAGGGIGAFFVAPFLATAHAFADRPGAAWVLDAVGTIGATAVIGVVLVLV